MFHNTDNSKRAMDEAFAVYLPCSAINSSLYINSPYLPNNVNDITNYTVRMYWQIPSETQALYQVKTFIKSISVVIPLHPLGGRLEATLETQILIRTLFMH
jgi:hypothetical protein